jgi:hypothetical protein
MILYTGKVTYYSPMPCLSNADVIDRPTFGNLGCIPMELTLSGSKEPLEDPSWQIRDGSQVRSKKNVTRLPGMYASQIPGRFRQKVGQLLRNKMPKEVLRIRTCCKLETMREQS